MGHDAGTELADAVGSVQREANADTTRWLVTLTQAQARFIAGAQARGYEGSVITRVWEMIRGFALYGFPESHAIAFALLIAVSGYLKRYYPA